MWREKHRDEEREIHRDEETEIHTQRERNEQGIRADEKRGQGGLLQQEKQGDEEKEIKTGKQIERARDTNWAMMY